MLKFNVDKILTIIVPSYNMEAYLPKCLGSLIVDDKELLQRLDVIVVNDGSKDRTSEIAHEFEAKYPGMFRVVDKENGNYGSCINVALKQLRGKFVKVLDADDVFDTDGLSRFLRFLESIEADLVLSDHLDVHANGHCYRRGYNFTAGELLSVRQFLDKSNFAAMHGITYKSTVFKRINYTQLEGVSYTDYEWDVLPIAAVKSVVYIPEVVYRYTVVREGQTSNSETMRRNYWMIQKMFLDLVRQYDYLRPALATEIQAKMDWLIAESVERCYRRGCIYGAQDDVSSFDIELRKQSKTIYDKAAHCRLGWLRINFASLHRQNSFIGRMQIGLYVSLLKFRWWWRECKARVTKIMKDYVQKA